MDKLMDKLMDKCSFFNDRTILSINLSINSSRIWPNERGRQRMKNWRKWLNIKEKPNDYESSGFICWRKESPPTSPIFQAISGIFRKCTTGCTSNSSRYIGRVPCKHSLWLYSRYYLLAKICNWVILGCQTPLPQLHMTPGRESVGRGSRMPQNDIN